MDYKKIHTKALLIIKYQQQTISESEREELEEWISQSEENRATFQRICSDSFVKERRQEAQIFDAKKGYSRLRQVLKSPTHRSLSGWLRRAVACAALLLMAGAAIFTLTRQSGTSESSSLTTLSTHGFSQAKLILAGGEVFEFSGKQQKTLTVKGAQLIASGECIEYTATGSTEETEYNTLEVPRKGEFTLRLSDGTKVWLNAESKLRYPVAFTGPQRIVYIEGEAYFEVQKDSIHPFIVKMAKRGEIGVTGTAFNVRSYSDEEVSQVTLVHGKVNLKNNKHQISLSPGEQGQIESEEDDIQKSEVNVNLYASWKDGRFMFKELPLEEIMKTIARWYDVDITYADEQVKRATFTGNLQRYDDFGKILNMLEAIQIAKFEIKGNHIYIYDYKKAN